MRFLRREGEYGFHNIYPKRAWVGFRFALFNLFDSILPNKYNNSLNTFIIGLTICFMPYNITCNRQEFSGYGWNLHGRLKTYHKRILYGLWYLIITTLPCGLTSSIEFNLCILKTSGWGRIVSNMVLIMKFSIIFNGLQYSFN